jgi:hypothetical protein
VELLEWSGMADDIDIGKGKPVTVPVISVFLFLAAVVALITGISLLFPGPIWNGMWEMNRTAYIAFEKMGRLSGAILLTLAAMAGIAGAGLLWGRRWAWWIAVVLFAINGLGDLINLILSHDLLRGGTGVLIAGAFLFFLTRPGVRRQLL